MILAAFSFSVFPSIYHSLEAFLSIAIQRCVDSMLRAPTVEISIAM